MAFSSKFFLFNTVYPHHSSSKSTVSRTIQKYEVFRQVKDLPRSRSPRTTTAEGTSLDLLLTVEANLYARLQQSWDNLTNPTSAHSALITDHPTLINQIVFTD